MLRIFCRLLIFFFKITVSNSFRNTISVSNGLDPDQARIASGLILIQTVCKDYKHTKKAPMAGRVIMFVAFFN